MYGSRSQVNGPSAPFRFQDPPHLRFVYQELISLDAGNDRRDQPCRLASNLAQLRS
jgi:hypothetical protein